VLREKITGAKYSIAIINKRIIAKLFFMAVTSLVA